MNAVDRFSNTLARYRQQTMPAAPSALPPQAASLPVYSVQPRPTAPRSDVEKAMDTVAQVTPILSRLAALVNRVQQPPAAATTAAAYPAPAYPAVPYPATAPYVGASQTVGQSLQRLGQAVGDRGVDTFVRQAAPVIDEALPLIDDIANLIQGKPRQQGQVGAMTTAAGTPYGTQAAQISQQVAPVVDGVTSLVSGVTSVVKAFEGLFKR